MIAYVLVWTQNLNQSPDFVVRMTAANVIPVKLARETGTVDWYSFTCSRKDFRGTRKLRATSRFHDMI